jgi:hypothetical protein
LLDYSNSSWETGQHAWRERLKVAVNDRTEGNFGITGLIVTGNLTVNGSLVNSNMSDGPFLLVMGTVAAHNLVAGGAHIQISGDANIRDVAFFHYNDGSISINGNLSVPVFINDDHDGSYKALINNQFKNEYDDELPEDENGHPEIPKDLRALLSDNILAWEDILANLSEGKEVPK